MSVHFRPITESDKKRMTYGMDGNINTAPIRINNATSRLGTVVSSSIFSTRQSLKEDPDFGDKVYEEEYTRVGYIDLVYPVLNQFLAGRKAPIWRMLLGLDEKGISDIINAKVIYDLETEQTIHISDLGSRHYNPERYIFGAKHLEYLLDKVDLDDLLNKTLIKSFVLPVLSKAELDLYKEGQLNIGTIRMATETELPNTLTGNVEGWLYDKFILDMSNSDFTPTRRKSISEDLFYTATVDDTVDLVQFDKLMVLTTLKNQGGVDAIRSQILNYVFVLPYGYRPTIDKRVDPLTDQYNRLVNANNSLKDTMGNIDPYCTVILNRYREVVQLVRNIFIGDDDVIRGQKLRNYKSLSDTITGKEGLMRGRMQGVRVDNSARTVITQDPDMPITCIGVPRKILRKVAEPSIIRGLRKYKPDNAQNSGFKGWNLSTFSTVSNHAGISYDEYLDKWFAESDRFGNIGRQPTLFYLGIEGFKIIPVDGDAIVLSPLIVMPFNADFDGDQMHFNMPVTPEAVKEVRDNMLFTNNYRYPKNGELTVEVRHEILYGLWMASKVTGSPKSKHWTDAEIKKLGPKLGLEGTNAGSMAYVYEAVCSQDIAIYDTVPAYGTYHFDPIYGKQVPAGIAAIKYAMGPDVSEYAIGNSGCKKYGDYEIGKDNKVTPVKDGLLTASWVKAMLVDKSKSNKKLFTDTVDRLVHLGFRVARVWPPNISAIIDKEIEEHVQGLIDEFNEKILKREELLNIGLEIESQFSAYFNEEWEKLKKKVTDYLMDNLEDDNGYKSMAISKAKGDKNNILQIFGLKGRVQKNDITAFNSIISGSYSRQLTGLEGFVSAYGSRKGIADKVLATAEPGYLSRKLEHAGAISVITAEDCNTTDGMQFTIEDVVPFIDESATSKFGAHPPIGASAEEINIWYQREETKAQYLAAREFLSKILVGRWCVEDNVSVYIEDTVAAQNFIDSHWGYIDSISGTFYPGDGVVVMRSPIHCKKPCCKKCYGMDIAAGQRFPKIGRPIGFIAAQSIGEPGTQLTMKNFQKGGVVTDVNLTSKFELIEDYFELHNLANSRKDNKGVISYDRISPVEGYVKVQHLGNGSKRIFVTETNNPDDTNSLIPGTTKIIVHEHVDLKDFVRVGDSFQRIQGDLNMKEVLKYRGYRKAALYLTLMLYKTFDAQDVNMKHFETIVASMSCGYLVQSAKSKNSDISIPYGKDSTFIAGSVVTKPEAAYAMVDTDAIQWTLIGLEALPKYKTDFYESLLMERMDTYIPRAILLNPNDSMSNPITRAAFGLNIGIGSEMR